MGENKTSYIRFGWGLHHVAGESDSYIIQSTDSTGKDYINSYGLGKLGMVELLCDCIDAAYKDDKVFAEWFKKQVANYFEVELRSEPISFEQSRKILSGEIDPVTLKSNKLKLNEYEVEEK